MKQLKLLGTISAVLLTMVMTNVQAEVLFDLSTVKLSGTTGANTFTFQSKAADSIGLVSGSNSLVWTGASSNSYSYIVSHFDSQTLAVGQTLQLDYSFTISNANFFRNDVTMPLRLGLFNSAGNLITASSTASYSPNATQYKGYGAGYNVVDNPPTGGNPDTFYVRSGSNNSNLLALATNGNGYKSMPAAPNLDTANGTSINGSFALTMTDDGLLISSIVNGRTAQTYLIETGYYSTFDTFSILAASGGNPSTLTFSNLTLSLIPEPSTFALLGIGALVVIGCRRFRKQR